MELQLNTFNITDMDWQIKDNNEQIKRIQNQIETLNKEINQLKNQNETYIRIIKQKSSNSNQISIEPLNVEIIQLNLQ